VAIPPTTEVVGFLAKRNYEYYDGSTDHYTTFRCCECGVETDIDVPGSVRDAVPFKKEWLNAHDGQ